MKSIFSCFIVFIIIKVDRIFTVIRQNILYVVALHPASSVALQLVTIDASLISSFLVSLFILRVYVYRYFSDIFFVWSPELLM